MYRCPPKLDKGSLTSPDMLNGTGSSHFHPSGSLFHNPLIDTIHRKFEPPWPGCLVPCKRRKGRAVRGALSIKRTFLLVIETLSQLITDLSTGFDLALSAG